MLYHVFLRRKCDEVTYSCTFCKQRRFCSKKQKLSAYHSSVAVQDVGYLKVKLLDISRETLERQAVLILWGLCYLT
jgi:hypothetical protein